MYNPGCLYKLKTALSNPVDYWLVIGSDEIYLNDLLGKNITLTATGNIFCSHCKRKTKTSFGQGYCFVCFNKLARCDSCIIHPEKCHFHLGTCREPQWGVEHCFIPHIVYLANTSGLKVGITRHTQVPTRWIDQGAIAALPIIEVRSRLLSGIIEHHLKKYLNDKTDWRAMLKGNNQAIDLKREAQQVTETLLQDLNQIDLAAQDITILDQKIIKINYPVLEYPNKIVSLNFDKSAQISGKLLGIKGQYLIFDCGVINIRKFTSYEVHLL